MSDSTGESIRHYKLLIGGLCIASAYLFHWISAFTAGLIYLLYIAIRCLVVADGDATLMLYEIMGKRPGTLRRKVVWITGASSGIGEGLALCLARGNCRLALSARTKDKLEDVKKRCLAASQLDSKDVLVLPFDILNYERHEPALKSILEHFGQLDILVSNAGRSQRARWHAINVEVDKELFELNVFSLVSLARLATKHFLSIGKGHHVVVASVAGKMGVPLSASYTGSKYALKGYFDSLRSELGCKGIAVTVVCPGPVVSNLMEGCFSEKSGQKGHEKRMGKMMSTERCADLIQVAVANQLSEVWISHQPILLTLYLNQYLSGPYQWATSRLDMAKIASKLRDGRTAS